MEPTEIIITNILPTGTAFGVLEDDMTQSVFIPSKLAIDAGLQISGRINASIVPNITHGNKTPWLAIALHVEAQPAQADITKLVIDALEDWDASAEDIAKEIKQPVEAVRETLANLISSGRVGRFELFGLVEAD